MIFFGKPVPTFPDHAAGNKKAPDLIRYGASDQMMRRSTHARTPPEPPEGLVLVVVLVVADVMGPDLWASLEASSTAFAMKTVKQRLNRTPMLRDKPLP
jgi:hypothetical protein